jgi:arylsulfatase A-like enzyme
VSDSSLARAFAGTIGRYDADSSPHWPDPPRPPAGAPNVVVILFDDVGFSDFGCYGSEIATPHIDRLAANGLRYANFHTTALCSPTRAALLTGRNHHSVGMGGLANWDLGYPGHRGRIAHSAATVAEMLHPHGYNTFAVGKWHLAPGSEISMAGPFDEWPLQRGFDRYYGFMEGETNQWKPELTEDNHHIEVPERPGYHLTEDLVDQSIRFITDQQSAVNGKPFLLYLAFGACHAPHHVAREFIDRYEPVFEKGWDVTREERLARQIELGLIPPGTELPERNAGVRAWADLSDDARRLAVRLQAAYAGMLEHTDREIGRLVAFLEHRGLLDDTLLMVLADNGASQEGSPLGTVNASRYFNQVRDDLGSSLPHLDAIGEEHLNNNYPWGWAMAGNTPFKRYKQNTHGGGVRDPLVVHWPAGIDAAARGGVRSQFHHVSDLTPTILEAVGVTAPEVLKGVQQQPIEGTSLRYSFAAAASDTPTRKRTQYFEMLGHRGIWHDGWKAVAFHERGTSFDEDRWELYHLDTDPNELHDLAAAEPARLHELVQRWWIEAARHHVLPLDGRPSRFAGAHNVHMQGRSRFELWPGSAHIPTDSAPELIGTSYTATAFLGVPDGGASGVLLAAGDSNSGLSLYFAPDGRLVHDYNYLGTHHVLRSPDPVPPGNHQCAYEFTHTVRGGPGTGRLLIDGREVARMTYPATLRGRVSFEGMDVGCDRLVAVGDYHAPFPFTGALDRVVIELHGVNDIDPDAREAAELAAQ